MNKVNLENLLKFFKKVEVQDGQKYISIEPLAKDLIIDFELIYKNPLIRKEKENLNLVTVI